jgi:hypothetical protein|tara:strand:- start:129 stop:1016 length:888 start_codon:yes stop_codon:yes gene_type:complete
MKKINGDQINSFLDRFLYIYQCLLDQNTGKNGYIKIENPTLSISGVESFNKSPSRLLCDIFWNSINYKDLEQQLKSKINFFDIGCGSGSYGNLIKDFSNDSFESYSGLDIYKSTKFSKEFNFFLDSANNAYKHIDNKTNFVMSQSALEHIEYDTLTIEKITKELLVNGKPFVQAHMVPASRSLWLYMWHGWRQYSKKNLESLGVSLKKKFNVNISIVPLGGSNSFWAHLRFITIPVHIRLLLFRDKNFKWCNQKNVEKKIVNSIFQELNCTSKTPIFWALIISSKNINLKYNHIY